MSTTRKRMDWAGFLVLINYLISKISNLITNLWTDEHDTFIANVEASYTEASNRLVDSLNSSMGTYNIGSEDNVTKITNTGIMMILMNNGSIASGAEPEYIPENSIVVLGWATGATGYTPVYKPTDTEHTTMYALCDASKNLIVTDKVNVFHEGAAGTGGTWSEEALEVVFSRNVAYMGGEQ